MPTIQEIIKKQGDYLLTQEIMKKYDDYPPTRINVDKAMTNSNFVPPGSLVVYVDKGEITLVGKIQCSGNLIDGVEYAVEASVSGVPESYLLDSKHKTIPGVGGEALYFLVAKSLKTDSP